MSEPSDPQTSQRPASHPVLWYVEQVALLLAAMGGTTALSAVLGVDLGPTGTVRAIAAAIGCLAWLFAFLVARRASQRGETGAGALLPYVLLGSAAIVAFACYLVILAVWVVPCDVGRYVVGTELTQEALAYWTREHAGRAVDDQELLFAFNCRPEMVWTIESRLPRLAATAGAMCVFVFLVVFIPLLLVERVRGAGR